MEWPVPIVTLRIFCDKKKHEVLTKMKFYKVIVEKTRQIIKNLGGFLITLLTRMEYFR